MKAVVAAFNQEKALVGAFSVITKLRMELFEALVRSHECASKMTQHLPRYHNNTMINFLAGVTVSTGRVAGAGAELWVAPAHMVQRSTITPVTCVTCHLSRWCRR